MAAWNFALTAADKASAQAEVANRAGTPALVREALGAEIEAFSDEEGRHLFVSSEGEYDLIVTGGTSFEIKLRRARNEVRSAQHYGE